MTFKTLVFVSHGSKRTNVIYFHLYVEKVNVVEKFEVTCFQQVAMFIPYSGVRFRAQVAL